MALAPEAALLASLRLIYTLIAASGDFAGTFFFFWMGYSGQMVVFNQAPAQVIAGGLSIDTIVFRALMYGLSLLLINAWAFYKISGKLLNPAVSDKENPNGSLPVDLDLAHTMS